ncbi:hypothetical protein, partial [Vibrio breoganii]|uniref:hypothetical protein n=1 Tax=Vibrio breoganii TaxID=553239 RepID=UPI001A7E0542
VFMTRLQFKIIRLDHYDFTTISDQIQQMKSTYHQKLLLKFYDHVLLLIRGLTLLSATVCF